jgi:hypothetical protein
MPRPRISRRRRAPGPCSATRRQERQHRQVARADARRTPIATWNIPPRWCGRCARSRPISAGSRPLIARQVGVSGGVRHVRPRAGQEDQLGLPTSCSARSAHRRAARRGAEAYSRHRRRDRRRSLKALFGTTKTVTLLDQGLSFAAQTVAADRGRRRRRQHLPDRADDEEEQVLRHLDRQEDLGLNDQTQRPRRFDRPDRPADRLAARRRRRRGR